MLPQCVWVVTWSLQPVLTLSHGINVCSHLIDRALHGNFNR